VNRAKLLSGAERAIDDSAVRSSTQLGSHKRAALAWLDVLEVEDLEDRSLDVYVVASLKLVGVNDGRSAPMLAL
jgi:hypothetical protein